MSEPLNLIFKLSFSGEGSQDKLPRQGDVEKDELVVPDNPRLRTDSEASGALSRSLFTENSLGSSHIPSVGILSFVRIEYLADTKWNS